jgi:hypothetical protein
MTAMRQGGCACGAVRYEFQGDPLFTHACHCTDCQRLTGGAFGVSMIIEESQLRLTKGQPVSGELIADSGNTKKVYFCGGCGSSLWNESSSRPGALTLKPGTLDDTDRVKPEAHIWTRSKQPWVQIAADTPAYETAYDASKVWPKESLERLRARTEIPRRR